MYASEPVLDICKEMNWKYIIRFKEGSIPNLYQEFKTVVAENNESKYTNYEFVTGLDYKKKYKCNNTDKEKGTEFVYITNLPIRNKNIKETISVGRKIRKIENEGFKMQKHGTFDIGHL